MTGWMGGLFLLIARNGLIPESITPQSHRDHHDQVDATPVSKFPVAAHCPGRQCGVVLGREPGMGYVAAGGEAAFHLLCAVFGICFSGRLECRVPE